MGAAGVGKTVIATQYAVAAARRQENVAVFVFDETTRSFRTRSAGLNLDVREHIAAGTLALRQIDTAEMSPGQFTSLVMQAVEENGARMIVIDSLSGYMNAMPEERLLKTHLHELLTYLSHRGRADHRYDGSAWRRR
jgi:circadian clock protein KaiC